MTTLTQTLAEHSVAISAASLPDAVVEQAKLVILDEIACAHFGRRSIAGSQTARYVESLGSRPEAQVFGSGLRASAALAAMANGAAGHGEEVDGAHGAGGHPGASIVHAAMATGEMLRATGAQVIAAVVAGYDVGIRLRWACGGSFGARRRLHLHADFLYGLASAVAAGKLIGHDADHMAHALALSTFQGNGLYATYAERRHVSKSFCEGQYAYAGVSAALMASCGLEGHDDIIGAPAGLLDAWGDPDGREIVLDGLGADYSIMGASFKFFNAGYPIHSSLEAALKLLKDHQLKADQIGHVTIAMNANARRIVDGRTMHNIDIKDMVAANIASGGLGLTDEPFPAMLDNPAFQALRGQITVEDDPTFKDDDRTRLGARMTMKLQNGQTVSTVIDYPRGYDSQGRIGWEDLREKWAGNLRDCDLDGAISLAKELDSIDDVAVLARQFATGRH
jgi:2-methylcitrate dehydratase PrpD